MREINSFLKKNIYYEDNMIVNRAVFECKRVIMSEDIEASKATE